MKISPKQYAIGLFELLAGQDKAAAEKTIASFVSFLAQNRDLEKEQAIVSELENIFALESGERKVELMSARNLPKETKEYLKAYLAKKSGSAKISISEEINPDIIGGFIVRYDDKVIDGSLKHHLSNFQKQLSN